MLSVEISEFSANINLILQKVQQGEFISLTSRGVEVARLIPPGHAQLAASRKFEQLRQTAAVGDVSSPLGEAWEVADIPTDAC